jgi:hypothetical protein
MALRGKPMPLLEYRVYIVDDANDRILQRIHLMCDSDEMAEERARQLVDRFPIELWQDTKLLGRFEPKQ